MQVLWRWSDYVELTLFRAPLTGQTQLGRRTARLFERDHPTARVVDAIPCLPVRVLREPARPARLLLRRLRVRLEIDAIAMLEAQGALVDRRQARAARCREGSDAERREQEGTKTTHGGIGTQKACLAVDGESLRLRMQAAPRLDVGTDPTGRPGLDLGVLEDQIAITPQLEPRARHARYPAVFTGIVQGDGRVTALVPSDGGVRLVLAAPFAGLELGESVSVNGACLTVAELAPGGFAADLSRETLERTSLGSLVAGSRVNLERALRLADRLGGHLVSGHVDGLARVVSVEAVGQTRRVEFQCPRPLLRYIAEKGSVALDGVSLTINAVSGDGFAVMLIPHTLSVTTLDELAPGRLLNLEVDQVARYVARFLEASGDTK